MCRRCTGVKSNPSRSLLLAAGRRSRRQPRDAPVGASAGAADAAASGGGLPSPGGHPRPTLLGEHSPGDREPSRRAPLRPEPLAGRARRAHPRRGSPRRLVAEPAAVDSSFRRAASGWTPSRRRCPCPPTCSALGRGSGVVAARAAVVRAGRARTEHAARRMERRHRLAERRGRPRYRARRARAGRDEAPRSCSPSGIRSVPATPSAAPRRTSGAPARTDARWTTLYGVSPTTGLPPGWMGGTKIRPSSPTGRARCPAARGAPRRRAAARRGRKGRLDRRLGGGRGPRESASTQLAGVGVGRAGERRRRRGCGGQGPEDGRLGRAVRPGPRLRSVGGPGRRRQRRERRHRGERRFGAGVGAQSFLGVFWGTGVGGGLVPDGRLVHGRGEAGEIGHVCVKPGGRRCNSGLRGCVEAYAGGRARGPRPARGTRSGRRFSSTSSGNGGGRA